VGVDLRAGERCHLVAFLQSDEIADGFGGVEHQYSEQFRRECAMMYLRGGETVQAARLDGRQPAVVTVPIDSDTELVTPTRWRLRDIRTGKEFNIQAIVPTDDMQDLELTCISFAN